ncbi:threonine/serine exporter family protein [Carboxylicivirga caseinilyticus]|uniref:threonine/serine exporter family protein n=1 Tax=Carboxylicivirga caseinilyticus TaxID=3417572 RepID=UPI003D351B87|nr:threonine/serine exporter family protein [Marinilabiliaceae bacterium A049]
MTVLSIFEHMLWPALASIGFAVLFNVPHRTLIVILGMGAVCGLTKYVTMEFGMHVITASFLAAIVVGFLSISAAQNKLSPMYVFAIPSIISMIPGAFSYRTMLGLIQLTQDLNPDQYVEVLHNVTSNGLNAVFVLLSISVGVSIPMLLTRHESAREIVALVKRNP